MLLYDSGLYSVVGLKVWSLVASEASCTLLEKQILGSTPGLVVGSKRIGGEDPAVCFNKPYLVWRGPGIYSPLLHFDKNLYHLYLVKLTFFVCDLSLEAIND